jgi:hypothetical protein
MVPTRNRRRLGADTVVGETGANDSDTNPFVLSCSSMLCAISEMGGGSFLSEGGKAAAGSFVLTALGRARRARRPTLSPFRSFSSRLSRAAVSSASCARASSVTFFRFDFASSAARLLLSPASFSSAAVLFSIWHFCTPPHRQKSGQVTTREITYSIRRYEGLEDPVEFRRRHVLVVLPKVFDHIREQRVCGVYIIVKVFHLSRRLAQEAPHLLRVPVVLLDLREMLVEFLANRPEPVSEFCEAFPDILEVD